MLKGDRLGLILEDSAGWGAELIHELIATEPDNNDVDGIGSVRNRQGYDEKACADDGRRAMGDGQ